MKKIQLTQGYTALVDDLDFELVNQFKWYAQVDRRKDGTIKNVYACRDEGRCRMHRFILGITDSETEVDHRDHQGFNNQRYNLRSTQDKNQRNARLRNDSSSGFKGVSWSKEKKKWKVFIKLEGINTFVGSSNCLLEAACMYDMAAVKHFGEYASCNFAEAS